MAAHSLAKIGVYLSPTDIYAGWAREAIEHAGIVAEMLDAPDFEHLSQYAAVVLVGRGTLTFAQQTALISYLDNQRGPVIFTGSSMGMDRMLGIKPASSRTVSRCWLKAPSEPSSSYPEDLCDIQFVGGCSVEADEGTVAYRSREGAPLVVRRGQAIYFGPHVGQTMGMLLVGRGVSCDSIGPGDGTAFTEDGLTRSEDGTNLRFEDRRRVGGCDTPVFADPHVDLLRDLWIRTILHAMVESGHGPALLWHLPENAVSAAVCSIDCDSLHTDDVRAIAGCLAKYGMPASWLVTTPGYPAEIYRTLRKWDHEIGLLFKLETSEPTLEQTRIQYLQVARTSSIPILVTTRGSNGYWHGYTGMYDVAEAAGSRMSLSKGGVQPGTSGFLFGTCHPFFPRRRKGRPFSVSELPFQAWRPGEVTPVSALPAIIQRCHSVNGVFHFGLCTSGAQSTSFDQATQQTLLLIRQAKMLQLTPERLFWFERARRNLRIRSVGEDIQLFSESGIQGLTLLIGGPASAIHLMGRPFKQVRTTRYGLPFTLATLDIDVRSTAEIQIHSIDQAA